jgi:hypothetical protein
MTQYVKPEIRDYGSFREVTAEDEIAGDEDGAGKLATAHHT